MAKRVQVVLNEDIKSLGNDGDLVEVAPGFARNFLLPNKKALPVTPTVLKQVEPVSYTHLTLPTNYSV